ncbi:MAG TPA: glycosyltransferase family protein [Terriglobales bacterium]|nr:glycosyltransferase family protein [Terriglobales bacterium]
MRIVAVVQARMGSTRLPGKVLMDLSGNTVLARVVTRLQRSKFINQTVVATTESDVDDAIICECERIGVSCFRGSEEDVLDRYYRAVREYNAETVVRVTADCPLIDPEIVDRTIELFFQKDADYATNDVPRTFPRGLDVEVFTMSSLEQAWQEARKPYERVHVTPYFYEHPEIFRTVSLVGESDSSRYRWTLDTEDDLKLLRAVYERFQNTDMFDCTEVLALMQREPELLELNSRVLQKSLQGVWG